MMEFVLLVAVNVRGRLFDDVAVTGIINDLPAGMFALGMGSMTGTAKRENGTKRQAGANRKNKRQNIRVQR
jgi:hypothetical protein